MVTANPRARGAHLCSRWDVGDSHQEKSCDSVSVFVKAESSFAKVCRQVDEPRRKCAKNECITGFGLWDFALRPVVIWLLLTFPG